MLMQRFDHIASKWRTIVIREVTVKWVMDADVLIGLCRLYLGDSKGCGRDDSEVGGVC